MAINGRRSFLQPRSNFLHLENLTVQSCYLASFCLCWHSSSISSCFALCDTGFSLINEANNRIKKDACSLASFFKLKHLMLVFVLNRNDSLVGATEILSLFFHFKLFNKWTINQCIDILHDGMVFKVLVFTTGPNPNGLSGTSLSYAPVRIGVITAFHSPWWKCQYFLFQTDHRPKRLDPTYKAD